MIFIDCVIVLSGSEPAPKVHCLHIQIHDQTEAQTEAPPTVLTLAPTCPLLHTPVCSRAWDERRSNALRCALCTFLAVADAAEADAEAAAEMQALSGNGIQVTLPSAKSCYTFVSLLVDSSLLSSRGSKYLHIQTTIRQNRD
jgi:hypothetical protein